MKRLLLLTLVSLLACSEASAEPAVPEWIVGEWQSNRSAYGKDPLDYCLLTVTANQFSWREYPKDTPRVFSYKVVVSERDFVILQAQHKYGAQHSCLRIPSPGYLRFDRKDYSGCIHSARRHNKPIKDTCPKPFSGSEYFELTVFQSLENALEHSDNPWFWTGYRKYEP